EKLGGRAEAFACHGKGLEIPAHDARGTTKSLAIQYAVGNPRGGCHSEPVWPAIWDFAQTDPGLKEFGLPWPPPSRFAETNVDRALGYKLLIEFGELAGVLGICRFALNAAEDRNLNPKKLSNLASAATGRDFSPLDLLKVSERAYNLKRCFNVREGVGRKDDKLPKRLMEPLATGPTKGQKVEDLDGMLDEFYQVMGWDQATGIPTKAKLEELGLSDVAETLWKS
ncbi:TPA: aldehyde ferredoxin oxidoreductase, partial [Candidatus Bathyarchaeota archaeon]|nr:aldehyde ferredoxin oxidoreductase [Candidatus Bathyarchaeota archaeon]